MTTEESKPKPKKVPRVVKTVRISQAGYDAAVQTAAELGQDWSSFVRDAVAEKIKRHKQQTHRTT